MYSAFAAMHPAVCCDASVILVVLKMKRMRIILAIVVVVFAACGRSEQNAKGTPELTAALRKAALLEPLPFKASPNEPIMVVVDMNFGIVGTTVVATKDGDASLYSTKGGAFIGGGGKPHIHAAALKLIRESAKHIQAMTPTTTYPFPSSGNVRFYVRTPQKVYTAEAPLARLMDDHPHALAPLFGAAMDVGMPLQDLGKEK